MSVRGRPTGQGLRPPAYTVSKSQLDSCGMLEGGLTYF